MTNRAKKGKFPVWITLKNGRRGRWTFHTLNAKNSGETHLRNLIDYSKGVETRETRDSLKWGLQQKTKNKKLFLKLIEWGLIEDNRDRERTIGDLLEHFQKRGVEQGTLDTYRYTGLNLTDFFGAEKLLREITPLDAGRFETFLYTAARRKGGKCGESGLRRQTAKKRIQRVKQFFKEARRLRWVDTDPFEGIHGGNIPNPERWVYVPKETVLEVMANTVDLQTRARIALCRFAGARGESEFRPLEWNADWIIWSADGKQGTVRLHRKKTEDSGFSDTIVPMVPELEAALRDLYDKAEPGTVKVFTPRSNPGKVIKDQFIRSSIEIITPYNLRRAFARDVMESGVDPRAYEAFCGHSFATGMKWYQTWDDTRARKNAPKLLEALTGSDSRSDRRADWRAVESDLESRSRLPKLAESGGNEQQPFINKEFSQEKENPLQEIAKGLSWGTGI